MQITKVLWAQHAGEEIWLYTLSNTHMEVSVTNFGATITSISVPDGSGGRKNIVLHYDSFKSYLHDPFYTGAVVGRFANRINDGVMRLNGSIYHLPVNEAAHNNHLHGGFAGFNKKVFNAAGTDIDPGTASLRLQYTSPDGEEGYPGNLQLKVTYSLTEECRLHVRYEAHTDRDTHLNLTQHTYFNLSASSDAVADHRLQVNSDHYLECEHRHLPTGKILPVQDTPYDFRIHQQVDARWNRLPSRGYNTYYVKNSNSANRPLAVLEHVQSGTRVEMETSYPGMLLYTGDFLTKPFSPNQGICLGQYLYLLR